MRWTNFTRQAGVKTIATVAIALCMAIGLVRISHASLPQELPKKFPEPVTIAEHDLKFFRKGQQSALSDEEIRALVKDYRVALTEAYSAMSEELAPLLIKPMLSDRDIARFSGSTSRAADRIAAATHKILRPFHFSSSEITELTSKYNYFDAATKASIQTVLGKDRVDLLDEIHMHQSLPFSYFMAGLSRRIGSYISANADERMVGGRLKVYFTIYRFDEDVTERETGLPSAIDRFLQLPEIKQITARLYDPSINAFHIVTAPSSIELSLDGVEPYYSRFGLNDTWEPTLKIILFEGNIRHRTRRFSAEWRDNFLKSVEVHEIMHALHRQRRQSCLAVPGTERKRVSFESESVNFYDLDEAQAQMATFAVLASENDPALNRVLALNLNLSHGYKIEEVFYKRMFERVKLRQRSQEAYARSEVVSELDRQYGLLLDAEAREVFDEAVLMLKKIADSEAQICD